MLRQVRWSGRRPSARWSGLTWPTGRMTRSVSTGWSRRRPVRRCRARNGPSGRWSGCCGGDCPLTSSEYRRRGGRGGPCCRTSPPCSLMKPRPTRTERGCSTGPVSSSTTMASWPQPCRTYIARKPSTRPSSARTIRTPWPPGITSPAPTRRRGGSVRRSRCSSRP